MEAAGVGPSVVSVEGDPAPLEEVPVVVEEGAAEPKSPPRSPSVPEGKAVGVVEGVYVWRGEGMGREMGGGGGKRRREGRGGRERGWRGREGEERGWERKDEGGKERGEDGMGTER